MDLTDNIPFGKPSDLPFSYRVCPLEQASGSKKRAAARTGSTLWTDPRVQGALTTGIFVLILIAAIAKSVQFPLHTWIPFAMFAPTPVSALLHAACYVKAGVYLMARLPSFGPWPASWGTALAWVGTVTLLIGALFGLAQRDLKRLLAYSTVSQIGYMMLASVPH